MNSMEIAQQARQASLRLQAASAEERNKALQELRQYLTNDQSSVLDANRKDLEVCVP